MGGKAVDEGPQVWIANKRETYVLPEPISAKFIKIEFSNLQPKSYNPGNFQLPIGFKKFPDWVSQKFISALSNPEFIAGKVGVVYDALEFAYIYYLGDLNQSPSQPLPPEETLLSNLQSGLVDPKTLEQINLKLNTYMEPPAALADTSTILGSYAGLQYLSQFNYPTESEPTFAGSVSLNVSTSNREAIVLDQGMPIMYFYLTCRHQYKEIKATFDKNRAYFAGVNEIAFIRDTYGTTSDTELYIESGTDYVNSERNDFFIEEGNWYTY